MKAISFLVLTLGAASASACSNYYLCHCYDSDGVPNNTVTQAVCNLISNQGSMVNVTGYLECNAGTWSWGWDNCEWRGECLAAKATGDDSSCRGKVFWI